MLESIGDVDIMMYGRKLGNAWGIEQKGKNNGILVLVAIEDRKMAILTGRGIEHAITDEMCHSLIETDLVPNFRKGDFYGGLDKCTDDLVKLYQAHVK